MTNGTRQDAISFLRQQHDTIRQLLAAVEDTSGGARRKVFEPLVRLLSVHETSEEMVVYPALRATGDEGRAVAEARKQEEDESKKVLAELEGLDPDSARFDELFGQLRPAVEDHAASEEREVFPILQQTQSERQLANMALALRLAQRIAPTHPHRFAPESALGNFLVGPAVSMFDRFRDAVRVATR